MKKNGFSLIEALMVVALIGLVVGIVVPNIPKLTSPVVQIQTRDLVTKVLTLERWGRAAGIDWGDTPQEVLSAIAEGRSPKDGAFNGRIFKLPPPADLPSGFEDLFTMKNGELTLKE